MINMLTVNKEREISDINNFYNTTVQEHSKLLNKVETDQKDMIGNYEHKLADYMGKNIEI